MEIFFFFFEWLYVSTLLIRLLINPLCIDKKMKDKLLFHTWYFFLFYKFSLQIRQLTLNPEDKQKP